MKQELYLQTRPLLQRDSLTEKRAVSSSLPDKTNTPDPGYNIEIDPLAALLIPVFFILDRIYGYITGKSANRKNWYFEIIVKPNLDKVDAYFEAIASKLADSIKELQRLSPTINADALSKAKTREVQKAKEITKKFEYDFCYLVQSHDADFTLEILDKLMAVQDHIATKLDLNQLQSLNAIESKNDIQLMKADFYAALYSRYHYKSWIRRAWEYRQRSRKQSKK